eukprot:TRINITY_DN23569_c0_g1_i1.p1 TRINITY_DN23569_c0_g1~~TRINITY_DN23569_c0_g1_i1.p1  ORF type:complete len:203 (+),score=37.27 TRINITY_DN23569_c0_g1_i1:370-978(+)
MRRGSNMLDYHRVQKEVEEIHKDKSLSGVSVKLVGDDLSKMKGFVNGPPDTPYEGGVFVVDISLPGDYPFKPPKMRFITKVWHPNVSSQNGAICLDILKEQWSPAFTVKTCLLCLQALLSSPQPDDPQDAVVAGQFLKEHANFVSTAQHWTEAFASPRMQLDIRQKISKFTEMGFSEDAAEAALEACEGDENAALEKLCTGS